MTLLLPLLVILAGFMFLATRRQKREAKAVQDMQSAIAVDDVVMMTSGVHGTVVGLGEDTVELEIAPGVVTTWNRLAVRQLVAEDLEDLEDDDEGDDGELDELDTEDEPDDVVPAEDQVIGSDTRLRLSKD